MRVSDVTHRLEAIDVVDPATVIVEYNAVIADMAVVDVRTGRHVRLGDS